MKRKHYLSLTKRYFRTHPIVAILGPRQCGKTTLALQFAKEHGKSVTIFDLEDPLQLASLNNPMFALSDLKGLIIIDEIQRRPELFPVLRVLADKNRLSQKYLILGSASRELIKQSSETLAGRIAYIELTPFRFFEGGNLNKLWVKGGFPRSFLAGSLADSLDWRKFYIRNFLENDIRNLGFDVAMSTMRRFWTMLSHYHANIFNASEIGRSLGVAQTTARNYLDILTGTFMIRELKPWAENIKKRQVKTPKIYFRDSGILNSLLGLTDLRSIKNHPKLGASFEGFALEEIISALMVPTEDCFFWATHSGAELDLLVISRARKIGFEFKVSDAPKLTKSMQIAMETLNLDQLNVIFPGKGKYKIDQKILAYGLETFLSNL